MITIKPMYITDENGKKVSVALPVNEFKALMKELE
jgi:PHD/YefM family antitoxin component YafN of YafNO toxin-antitoxin module